MLNNVVPEVRIVSSGSSMQTNRTDNYVDETRLHLHGSYAVHAELSIWHKDQELVVVVHAGCHETAHVASLCVLVTAGFLANSNCNIQDRFKINAAAQVHGALVLGAASAFKETARRPFTAHH